jgi:cation:H+ antiporter
MRFFQLVRVQKKSSMYPLTNKQPSRRITNRHKKKGECNMSLLPQFVFLVIGFVLLIKGADYFVEGASLIASKFGIPQIVIGLTIVACGTSAPEAAVSISAAFKGTVGITVGNIVGSNIMNILLILGITAIVAKVPIKEGTVKVEMPFVIVITGVLLVLGLIQGDLSRIDGAIMWIFFLGFFGYLIHLTRKDPVEDEIPHLVPMWKMIVYTIGGLIAIVWGSDITVDAATEIAKALHVTDRIIGLTVVAFGTSLPELVTSVTAAMKGKTEIAVGNIVGSNIFNILFVVGTVALIHPIPFSMQFVPDLMVAIFAAVILWVLSIRDRELTKGNGTVMLLCYVAYIIQLVLR